jgi:signal transduction histidine kinase
MDAPVALTRGAAVAGWAAVAAFVVVGLVVRLPDRAPLAVGAAAVALAGALLLVRGGRLLPVGAAVATAGVAVLGSGMSSNVGWFAVCLVGGWCALSGTRATWAVGWLGWLLLFAVQWLWVQRDPGWAAWMTGTTCTVLAALVVRRERGLLAELRAAQAGLSARARAEERNRIARELHDVIAHSLTVSLLHIGAARMAVRFDPADADRALAEAERLGRQSLEEVRGTVGLLRAEDDGHGPGAAAPLPGLDGLPELVRRFRDAGAPVDLDLAGTPGPVPATTGLAVYRIVQEALTNAAKHAPGTPVRVTVRVGSAAVVDVDSDGAPGPVTGSGLGLHSMRERAGSVGGTLRAGPHGAGWQVHAELPLPAAAGREVRR